METVSAVKVNAAAGVTAAMTVPAAAMRTIGIVDVETMQDRSPDLSPDRLFPTPVPAVDATNPEITADATAQIDNCHNRRNAGIKYFV